MIDSETRDDIIVEFHMKFMNIPFLLIELTKCKYGDLSQTVGGLCISLLVPTSTIYYLLNIFMKTRCIRVDIP